MRLYSLHAKNSWDDGSQMNRKLSELLWADLGNEPSLEVCANIAELCTKQCRPLPFWLRGALQSSPASDRLFKAEMDRRGWKRYAVVGLAEYWRMKSEGAFSDCDIHVRTELKCELAIAA